MKKIGIFALLVLIAFIGMTGLYLTQHAGEVQATNKGDLNFYNRYFTTSKTPITDLNELIGSGTAGTSGQVKVHDGTDYEPKTISATGDVTGTLSSTGAIPLVITANTVSSADILNGTIALIDMASDSVNAAKIVDNTVSSADILNGTVALIDMASDSVNAAKIVDNTVSTADILNGTILSGDIATNTVSGGNILNGTIADTDMGWLKEVLVIASGTATNSTAASAVYNGTLLVQPWQNTTDAYIINTTMIASGVATVVVNSTLGADFKVQVIRTKP